MDFVEETIGKYEKFINPSMARLFRFMGLGSVETTAHEGRMPHQ